MTDINTCFEYLIRLLMAAVCGGLIGYERKRSTHPAGLRTHILVCISSALVMITSEFVFTHYSGIVNLDPMRLGAQIISGIGFLGAGAIVKEGVNIKGLTTAACLWAVACVGIAIGVGFYFGALLAVLIIFIVLICFRSLERFLTRERLFYTFVIETEMINRDNSILSVKEVLAVYKAKINRISDVAVGDIRYIKFEFFMNETIPEDSLLKEIGKLSGVSLINS